ncbi:MAG: DUF1849 family protein [Geminicoccaceae bacterium]|nr:cell envelope integrity EipB family protein [Geminicoccaceae bacterium]MDW8123817.1 DUF1849 family protein [Geminicoccaceae bacterium]MDW8341585.1 DUF1849 family protein [Geminicoccaceae bacterium]
MSPRSSLLLLALFVWFPVVAQAVELVPHRAAYRVTLAPHSRGPVTEVRGGLVLEWRAGCEGWVSNQRLGFVAGREDGSSFSYDVRFSSWESRDGTELHFSVTSFENGKTGEEIRGRAELEAPGGPGRAVFVLPAESEMALPPGTLFPTRHIAELIRAAERGERFVAHLVFDGSGENALSNVSAVIGPARSGPEGPRWPVTLAYFGVGSADPTPDFTIGFELDARGVLHAVTLDYGEFVLEGRLDRLELLPRPECP